MPIYVGFSQKRRTVKILNAGRTQYLLCPPADIELAAELNDISNLRNHTLFWEQLTGPEVTLASEDTIGTSFPYSNNIDKKFRFWIDYGTNKAQYKDVDIFYTPTSVMVPRALGSKRFHQSMTTPNLAQQDSFILSEPDGTLNSNVDIIPATAVTFDPQPTINLNKSVKMEILTDAGFVTNPEDIYASYDYAAGEFQYLFDLPNGVYKFRFYYDFGSLTPTIIDSPLIVLNSHTIIDNAWAIDDVHDMRSGIAGYLGLSRFSIERKVITHSHTHISGVRAGLLTANNTIWAPGDPILPGLRLTPVKADDLEYPDLRWNHNLYNVTAQYLTNLTRLDPSNIGS